MTAPSVNGEQVAVLAERVDALLQNYSKFEGLMLGMTSAQSQLTSQIAVFQERLSQVHDATRRITNTTDLQGEMLEKVQDEQKRISEEVSGQRLLWKIFGTVALFLATAALGLAGWVNNTVGITERRVSLLELAIGMRNMLPNSLNQPTQGNKP